MVWRGVIVVVVVVVYFFIFSLLNLVGFNWRSIFLCFYLIVIVFFLVLIVVNIVFVMVIRLYNRKIECLLEGFVRLLNYFGVELKCR